MMRATYIDQLKAFGILCVVISHNDYTEVGEYINTFVMPLFFFLSGMMFKNSAEEMSFTAFAIKKAKRLMIPYFA